MKSFVVFCIGALAGAFICGIANRWLQPVYRHEICGQEVVRDSIVVHDTVCVTVPQLTERRVVDTMVVSVPVSEVACHGDSADVALERSQLVCTDDSTYKVWISGYDPRLDSLKFVYRRSSMVIERHGAVDRASKWGVTVSAGIGINGRGLQPFLGIGVSYTLIAF